MAGLDATETTQIAKPSLFEQFAAFVRMSVSSRWEIARELPKSGAGLTVSFTVTNYAAKLTNIMVASSASGGTVNLAASATLAAAFNVDSGSASIR